MKIITASLLIFFSVTVINAQDNKVNLLQDLEKGQVSEQNIKMTATLRSATRLFGAKDDLTSVITMIPAGAVVDVVDSDSTYLKVSYEDSEGFILKRHAEVSEKPVAEKPVAEKAAEQSVSEQPEAKPGPTSQNSRFTYLENKYGTSLASKLMAGKIWKGMDAEMIQDSWGTPKKINRVISGNTVKEEWIFRSTWLYVEDDRLVDWGPVRN